MISGVAKLLPSSSENAILTAETPFAPVNQATATNLSIDEIAGPLTGHPDISHPSSFRLKGSCQPFPSNRAIEISRN